MYAVGFAVFGFSLIMALAMFFHAQLRTRGSAHDDADEFQEGFGGLGKFVRYLQLQALLHGLQVRWPAPLVAFFTALRFFQMDVAGPFVHCAHGQSLGVRIATQWSIAWGALAITPGAYAWYKRSGRCVQSYEGLRTRDGARVGDIPPFLTAGYLVFALSLAKLGLIGYECSLNPTGSSTLTSFRDVVCGGREHSEMLGWIIAHTICFIVCPLAWIACATRLVPAWLEKGTVMGTRFEFLISKFRTHSFYWGLVSVVVSISVSAVPSLSSGDGFLQAMAISALALGYGAATLACRPFTKPVDNGVDVSQYMLILLQLIVALGCGFADSPNVQTIFRAGTNEEERRELVMTVLTFGGAAFHASMLFTRCWRKLRACQPRAVLALACQKQCFYLNKTSKTYLKT